MQNNFSRSLIIAWAALLIFILGMLTWISIMPAAHNVVGDDIPAAIDLQLPEAMPVDKFILKDEKKTEDTGGAASAETQIQLAETHLEPTKYGEIPALGADGKGPGQLYAAQEIVATDDKIKVAFIFSNLGRNAPLHDKILASTPPGVTLAYLPYGNNLKNQMSAARSKGHEVLMNLPMEPADYPYTDTGPNTLLTGLTKEQNMDRLHWALAQGHEYVGVMNLHGSLFLASSQDLKPVLHEIDKRGLLFVESETCYRSQVQTASHTPRLKSHFLLGESLTPSELQATLIRAEQMAEKSGFITIVAHTSPLNMPVLLTWIKKAQEQNYVFVPVSQAANLVTPQKGEAL